jgi:hypothetical protein
MTTSTVSRRQTLAGVAATAAAGIVPGAAAAAPEFRHQGALGALPAGYNRSIDALIAQYDIDKQSIIHNAVDYLVRLWPPPGDAGNPQNGIEHEHARSGDRRPGHPRRHPEARRAVSRNGRHSCCAKLPATEKAARSKERTA